MYYDELVYELGAIFNPEFDDDDVPRELLEAIFRRESVEAKLEIPARIRFGVPGGARRFH
jgi:hypothetical protein